MIPADAAFMAPWINSSIASSAGVCGVRNGFGISMFFGMGFGIATGTAIGWGTGTALLAQPYSTVVAT
jgi:hypothetical protein